MRFLAEVQREGGCSAVTGGGSATARAIRPRPHNVPVGIPASTTAGWPRRRLVHPVAADRRGRAATVGDIGGGFGDAALLVPLAVALITVNHLNATAVFAGAGLLYLVSGLVYRLPVPVQPLKAVSAIAIGAGLGPNGIAAAGLLIGALFVVLGLTGLADRLRVIFTGAIIRGIQLAVGVLLVRTALEQMLGGHPGVSVGGGAAGLLVGAAVTALVALAAWRRVPGIPFAVLGGGLLVGVVAGHPAASLQLGPAPLALVAPSGGQFLSALWVLAIPQLALSLGNSLMATSSAAASYFGERARRVTPAHLALTMGAANLVVSPLGGMPMCHGAGGLTAHVRMGARSGRATAAYGVVLVALALIAGAAAPALLAIIPPAVLAGLLLYVGLMHATLVTEVDGVAELAVALVVAGVASVTLNITAGVIAGLLAEVCLRGARRLRATV